MSTSKVGRPSRPARTLEQLTVLVAIVVAATCWLACGHSTAPETVAWNASAVTTSETDPRALVVLEANFDVDAQGFTYLSLVSHRRCCNDPAGPIDVGS